MFDNNMMQKLQQMQQQMEDTKKRLESITVQGEAAGGKVSVTATAGRRITAVNIADELMQADKEELEDYLILALNDALSKADNAFESEMQGIAGGLF